ncbi:MAG: 30S ribosomal protein S8 [Gammaproteobacteria bacterium]|nr:30S ribosomal protein S8 [Gammaproteobacteria bacterium]MBU6509724.1 30S ribosomal protein S8 [Gammaproteobacteria bacterium]MDE1983549.1 30S ribosomal protein S8 [Gammaproteobacteria bacterium]MDE2107658.1 30S ribosomal protein S8 [Gammaproteobacteria bacterium]MDE2460096.1 30S ribosomal protein S8 [Gammaproteobacteria bacterium]
MSMTDPIADMFSRIRNGQLVGREQVSMPASRIKCEIARVLQEEGYIESFARREDAGKAELVVTLKYHHGRPVIDHIRRVSRPGLRVYKRKDELPKVLGGFGIAIVSTPKGLMSDRAARAAGQGGEVLCTVS